MADKRSSESYERLCECCGFRSHRQLSSSRFVQMRAWPTAVGIWILLSTTNSVQLDSKRMSHIGLHDAHVAHANGITCLLVHYTHRRSADQHLKRWGRAPGSRRNFTINPHSPKPGAYGLTAAGSIWIAEPDLQTIVLRPELRALPLSHCGVE